MIERSGVRIAPEEDPAADNANAYAPDAEDRFIFPNATILGAGAIANVLIPGHDSRALTEAFDFVYAFPGFIIARPRRYGQGYWPSLPPRLVPPGSDSILLIIVEQRGTEVVCTFNEWLSDSDSAMLRPWAFTSYALRMSRMLEGRGS